MGTREVKLAVFAWLPREGFVPAGLLTLSETVGANPLHRALTSSFAYGLRYLARPCRGDGSTGGSIPWDRTRAPTDSERPASHCPQKRSAAVMWHGS